MIWFALAKHESRDQPSAPRRFRLARRDRKQSDQAPRSWSARLFAPEQIAIAAAHAANCIPDQTNDLGATRRCQPFAAGLAADERVEQHSRYLAIACMLLPAV
jgi:hypothetical protein